MELGGLVDELLLLSVVYVEWNERSFYNFFTVRVRINRLLRETSKSCFLYFLAKGCGQGIFFLIEIRTLANDLLKQVLSGGNLDKTENSNCKRFHFFNKYIIC